ncbi:MAG: hypothetical protein HQL60_07935 [Magnetococcales bacterium]|nr:hypothetical protein [Magnetococcales bacterium]
MSWISQLLHNTDPLHQEMLTLHDQLVDQTLSVTSGSWLGIKDDFSLRFEVLMLLVAAALYQLKQHESMDPVNKKRAQQLWEITFESFDHTLRQQGVSDIRMSARMHKLLQQATGRRNAYLVALDNADPQALRRAISRNILNCPSPPPTPSPIGGEGECEATRGSKEAETDPRIERLLELLRPFTQEFMDE